MDKTPMTSRSHKASTEELHRLKIVERKKAADAIAEARAHGDISENAEYEAAKDAQGILEARIRLLESRLSTAQVVDVSRLSGEKVLFGATVTFDDVDSGETKTVMIVGEDEADVDAGLISYVSPLARALIGKSVDDIVQVKLPSGMKEYEIRAVEFKE
jgi:transcription elongation factor GreA